MSDDDLLQFTEKLHRPPGQAEELGQPDWGIAPPAYRPRAHMLGWRLPSPLAELSAAPDPLEILSTLLWTALGCDRVRLFPNGLQTDAAPGQPLAPRLLPGRPIASGGASYPADLVVALQDGTRWRYAPQYHALFRQEGIDNIPSPSSSDGSANRRHTVEIHVCVNFHRTWLKYRDFAYRLTAVDLGVLLARLCTVAHSLGIATQVDVDGPGAESDRTLGLDQGREAGYATVRMNIPGISRTAQPQLAWPADSLVSPLHSPPNLGAAFKAMHDAASGACGKGGGEPCEPLPPPQPTWQFNAMLDAIRARRSSGESFDGSAIEASVLQRALSHGQAAMTAVCGGDPELRGRMPTLRCTVIKVQDHPPGIYRFDTGTGVLECEQQGRFADDLQHALYLGNVNLDAAGFVIHPFGPKDWRGARRGPRAYRVDQMLAGAALEGAMLAASGPGRTAHAFLGFSADQIDSIYRVPVHLRALAQLAVGNCRHRFGMTTSTVT